MKPGRRLMDMTQGEIEAAGERQFERDLARYEREMERRDKEYEWLEEIAPDWDEAA